jgi:hypothetical protein
MKIKILALVLMLGIVGRADSDFISANTVLPDCENESIAVQNDCVMYLAGVVDATETWIAFGQVREVFCIPNDVNLDQLRKIFIKFANEHPEDLHSNAGSVVINALFKAFPCE